MLSLSLATLPSCHIPQNWIHAPIFSLKTKNATNPAGLQMAQKDNSLFCYEVTNDSLVLKRRDPETVLAKLEISDTKTGAKILAR
jgi:hypothetical protein